MAADATTHGGERRVGGAREREEVAASAVDTPVGDRRGRPREEGAPDRRNAGPEHRQLTGGFDA